MTTNGRPVEPIHDDPPGSRLAVLARNHATPLYVYDLERLDRRVREIRQALALSRARLFFATMANDRAPILNRLSGLGVGACVNSALHLDLARSAGFQVNRIQFTSTGVTPRDMRLLQQLGVRANLDSLGQLRQWFEFGAPEAGLRINAASLGGGLPHDRIGVDAACVPEAVSLARDLRGKLSGLHVYVGTNFQDPDEMLPTLHRFFDLASRVETLSYVNVGGGIGVDYQRKGSGFDLGRFGNGIADFAEHLRAALRREVEVIVEPGRSLTANCGTFLTTVTDVKLLGHRRYAAVDGSIAVFPRPFHHPDSPHRVTRASPGPSHGAGSAVFTIVGRTTFSRDIFGEYELPSDLAPGDVLSVSDAGSYSQSMASRFLGQAEPGVVFLADSEGHEVLAA